MSNESIEMLQDNEVINFQNDLFRQYLCLPATCLVKDVKNAIANKAFVDSEIAEQLLDGIECEVIQLTKQGWKKGKIKISCEFYPDEEI
jgi:hypothetical protein